MYYYADSYKACDQYYKHQWNLNVPTSICSCICEIFFSYVIFRSDTIAIRLKCISPSLYLKHKIQKS
jgi:hypothetical protein